MFHFLRPQEVTNCQLLNKFFYDVAISRVDTRFEVGLNVDNYIDVESYGDFFAYEISIVHYRLPKKNIKLSSSLENPMDHLPKTFKDLFDHNDDLREIFVKS